MNQRLVDFLERAYAVRGNEKEIRALLDTATAKELEFIVFCMQLMHVFVSQGMSQDEAADKAFKIAVLTEPKGE